jgi:hypothetical protein
LLQHLQRTVLAGAPRQQIAGRVVFGTLQVERAHDSRVAPRHVEPECNALERGAIHVVRQAIEIGVAAEHDEVLTRL